MGDISALMQDAGVEDLGIGNEGIQNTGFSYYEHLVGEGYQAIVGKLIVTHIDRDGKKAEKKIEGVTKIGSVRAELMIIKDPEMQLVNEKMEFPADIPYGRLIFNQFVSLEGDKQWANVRAFIDFTVNGQPEAAVIQGKKNEEQVFVNNIQLYYGCPCSFTVEAGKKEGQRFIKSGSLKLSDHTTLTQDLLKKRKGIADSLKAKLSLYLDTQKEKNKASKKEEDPTPSAPVQDSFLDGVAGDTGGFS